MAPYHSTRFVLAKQMGLILLSVSAFAQQYTAQRQGEVVRLEDVKNHVYVLIMPSHGNGAFEMRANGKKVIQFPYDTAEQYKAGRSMSGIPFLAPWANRLDDTAFYANGKKYVFNMDLGNVRATNNIPMHGFLTTASQWEVTELKSDGDSAWVTSRLDFYRQPDWMAQFPFAHTIEMTYRLHDGVLEVKTALHNLSAEPMPVAIGFHPYFQVNDAPRDEWTIGIAARTNWVLKQGLPNGETRPIEELVPNPAGTPLKGLRLDDVFTDLVRDASGRATMFIQGKKERVEVLLGPNYRSVVVWAPGPTMQFVCLEPMAGITNALNLAQKGIYKELQYVQPGGVWQESFWVRPVGF